MTESNSYAERYHELYSDASPEYVRTLTRWGRMLTPAQVEDILSAHSLTVADLLTDTSDDIVSGELPERMDAAMLYAWLGY